MTMRISKDKIDMDDKVLQKPVLKDYGETVVGGASGTNTGSTYTIDLRDGNVFNLTLTANCTFTFSNPPASGTMGSFTLYLNQDATGSRTVTWPGAVTWIGGTEPTLSTTASAIDILIFYTLDAGTTWFGSLAGVDFSSPPDRTLEYLTYEEDISNLTTYTFSSVDIGFAETDRVIAVTVHWEGGSATLSTVEIGGVSATEAVNGSAGARVSLNYATVTTGTTGDIVVTFASAPSRCAIGVWRMTGLNSATPVDTDSATSTPDTGLSISLNVETDDFIIAGYTANNSASFTWTGVTERFEEAPESNSGVTGGDHTAVSDDATYSVSISHSTNSNMSMAGAVWR